MPPPAITCAVCGRHGLHGHHITGRAASGDQLHEALTVPLCHRCHGLIHEDLRHQRVDNPPTRPLTIFEAVERCLRRAALLAARIAETRASTTWAALAGVCLRLAEQLAHAIDALDRHAEGWRTHLPPQGVTP